MKKQTVGVIVVNYNGGKYLQKSIKSLYSQTLKPDRIILVDNGSTEKPILGDEDWLQGLDLLKLDENLGFSAANNVGIQRLAEFDWVALLNPDAFAEKDWLVELLGAAKKYPEYASFSSRMLDAKNPKVLDGVGDVYCTSGRAYRRAHGEKVNELFLKEEEVFSACAGAALYRTSAILEVGGFDESFFCYLEDVDLGFRLRLMGFRCLYVPSAMVLHVGSATAGKSSPFTLYHSHRNLVWVFLKNMPLPLLMVYGPLHLFLNIASLWLGFMRGQFEVIFKGKVDAIRGLPRVLKARKVVQGKRRASILSVWRAMSAEPSMRVGFWIKKAKTSVKV